MVIIKRYLLPVAISVSLVFHSSISYAVELTYGLGVGVDYSDNITRSSQDEISGTTRRASLVANLTHQSESVDLLFRPVITYNNYTPEELQDRTSYQLDSSLVWEIVNSRLSWTIEDYIAQTLIDVTGPDTTFNQQTTNVFFTGPDLTLNVGAGFKMAFLLRYADFYYEVDDTVDNERVGGLFSLINQFKSYTNYSLNLAVADIRYKNEELNENYNRNDIFLGFERETNYYELSFDLGYTLINRDVSEDLDGQNIRFNLLIKLNTTSNLALFGRSEYTDSSRNFLLSRYFPEELRRFNTATSADILFEDSLLAAYRWNDQITNLIIEISHVNQDYEDTAFAGFDRTIQNARIGFTRRASRLANVFATAAWTKTDYETTTVVDDDQLYTVGIDYRLSRSLFTRLDYSYAKRDSTDINNNYVENSVFVGLNYRR